MVEQGFCVNCGQKLTQSGNENGGQCEDCDQTQQEDTPGNSNRGRTRREILKLFGSGITTGYTSSLPAASRGLTSRHQPEARPAYVMLPALSTTTLLANLPCLLATPSGSTPLILMDVHDYDRLRGAALSTDTTPWRMHRAIGYDELRRRGIIQLLDYSEFYPAEDQAHYIDQNRALIEEAPTWGNRRAALTGIDHWFEYTRGDYLGPFRERFGEDPSSFANLQDKEHAHRRAMDRGRGHPAKWNEQVFDQYTAALAVRRHADRTLDLDVKYVIGEGESTLIDGFLTATRGRRLVGPSTNSPDFGMDTLRTDISHLNTLEFHDRIRQVSPDHAVDTRQELDVIGEIATKIVGTQHCDWSLLGSSIAVPQNNDIFDLTEIREQIRNEIDIDRLVAETTEAIDVLKRESEPEAEASSNKVRYDAERLVEQREYSPSPEQHESFTKRVDYAVDLVNYSRELRYLQEQGEITQAAAFAGASIMSDPVRRYHDDEAYRRGVELVNRLDPPSLDKSEFDAFLRHGDQHDWYETEDRKR